MKNVDIKVDQKTQKVTITIDLKARHGVSKSGKTVIVASTEGNVSIPGHESIKLGINAYSTDKEEQTPGNVGNKRA